MILSDKKRKIKIPSHQKEQKKRFSSSETNSDDNVEKGKVGSKKKLTSKNPTLNKDLNLFKEGNKPSLKEFVANYNAPSNMAWNVLFVYYLREIKSAETVGIDEIYTCYKNLGLKIPNVKQSLLDTAFRKGWLNTESLSDIKLTISGENAVSHELLKSSEKAA